jgi:hypothetical protein
MSESKAKTVVILGMHRSGTSMVGGVLARLGVNMGEKFRDNRIISNPLGFYEDVDFLNLNNEILKEAGGSWENPPEPKQILSQKSKFEGNIEKLLNEKQQLWGWKDPRTCLTIRLFLPYLHNVYFIVCHREPEAVANSLFKRSGMGHDKSIKLYTIYEKEIENFFKDYPNLKKLTLVYKDIISNPKENVDKILKFLDISVNKRNYEEAIDFILPTEKRSKIKRRLLIRHLIKKGIKNPFQIPNYILKKMKKRLQK